MLARGWIMANEVDIANARAELELALALQARQRIKDAPSVVCIDCGTDNAARARIGRHGVLIARSCAKEETNGGG